MNSPGKRKVNWRPASLFSWSLYERAPTYLKIRIFAPVIACEKAAHLRNREKSRMSSTRKETRGGGWWGGDRRPRRLFARFFTVELTGELTRRLLRTVINVKEKVCVQFWLCWCNFEICAFFPFRTNRTADGL